MTGILGHVDPNRMGEYRYWRARYHEADGLFGVLSGLGYYDLANAMSSAAAVLKQRANECRVRIEQLDV